MNNYIKEFIEDHKELILNNKFEEIYTIFLAEEYANHIPSEFYTVLAAAGIDTLSIRENVIDKLILEALETAATVKMTIQDALDQYPNFLGFNVYYVVEQVPRVAAKNKYDLTVSADDTIIFSDATNYFVDRMN